VFSWYQINAVSCYCVQFISTLPSIKLEDTHFQMSAVVYSVYYQLSFVRGRHPLHHNLRSRRTVMTWTHLILLMIHSNYHHNYHHHPVFSVTITVLLIIFISLPDLMSIINTLMSLSIIDCVPVFLYYLFLSGIQYFIDSLMTFSTLFIPHWNSRIMK
jgi:hypothetical protein